MSPRLARVALLSSAAVVSVATIACGAPARPPELPEATPAAPSIAPPSIAPSPAVARVGLAACDAIRLDVDVAKLHASRRGPWLAAIAAAEPRIGGLAIAGKIEPLEAATTARLCSRAGHAWEAVVVRHVLADSTVRDALRVYGARVDRGGPVDLGLRGVRASKIRVATDVWTAVERDEVSHELWLVVPEAARPAVTEHAALATIDPLGPLAARAFVREPATRLPWGTRELEGVSSLEVGLTVAPDGSARLEGEAITGDERSAVEVARRLNATVSAAADTLVVRIALRGILSGFSAIARGSRVAFVLPAPAPAVDSLLALVAASAGARLPPPKPAPAADGR